MARKAIASLPGFSEEKAPSTTKRKTVRARTKKPSPVSASQPLLEHPPIARKIRYAE